MSFKLFNSLKLSFIFLLFLCFFIFFNGIGNYGLLDKDEPRYCSCALEMIERSDYISPKFNFENRFDKPVLFYWLIAASYKLFGVSDFTSRLPSAVCATLCVLFTWYVGRTVLGKIVGLLGAIILTTSIEYVLLGRRAATDMALCLFFSGSLYSLYLGYFIKDFKIKIIWTILAGIFSGLAILIKGPVGIILPLIILSLFLILRKQFDIKHLKIYFLIIFFAALVSFPWYIAVHFASGGEFTKEFFFKHNIQRFTNVLGEHPGPSWFYIPVILGGFMPWTLFLFDALFHLVKRLFKKSFNRFILFCLVWAIIVFLFFSLSSTKLATYVLLLFPPLSLIAAYWISILGRKNLKTLKSICFIFLFFVLMPSLYYGFFLISRWEIDIHEKNMLLGKCILYLLIMFSGLILSLTFSKRFYTLILFFALSIIMPFILIVNSYLVPYYKHTHADLRSFALMAKKEGASEIISFGMYRPSLVYYSRIHVDFNNVKDQIKKMKSLIGDKKNILIVGHTSDIQKYKKLFEKVKIIEVRKKYFVGKVD